jgi:DNA-directed RNA polymerase subunit H (RpoH/RPB5)
MSQDNREDVVVKPAPAIGNMLGIYTLVSFRRRSRTGGETTYYKVSR